MTLFNFTRKQPTRAQSLDLARRAESVDCADQRDSAASCSFQIKQIVEQIDAQGVREIVSKVFDDLLCLLDCLRPMGSHLHCVDEAEETFALLNFIRDEAYTLVKFIKEEALTCEALNEELFDTLDGINFAVNHDLHRVFEAKPPESTEERKSLLFVGKLFRAHDLLTNCLQQATISLATFFDPELVGTKLFSDLDERYQQSLQLCEDLSTLLKLIDACAKTPTKAAFARLTAGIEKFRSASIDCLRYSDWPEFAGFCERTQLATTTQELEPVLHQFHCYVETLLGQVKMRAVLANAFPTQFGDNEIQQLMSPPHNSSTQFYSPGEFQDGSVTEDTLAIAV